MGNYGTFSIITILKNLQRKLFHFWQIAKTFSGMNNINFAFKKKKTNT